MKWFRNLRTMVKILLLATVMTSLMLVIAYTGYSTSYRIANRMKGMYENEAKVALDIMEAKYLAASNRRMLLSLATTSVGSEIQSYEDRIMGNRREIAGLIGDLNTGIMTQEELDVHAYLKKIGPEYRSKQDEAMNIAKSGFGTEELEDRLSSRGDIGALENEYVTNLDKLAKLLVASADEVSEGANDFARKRALTIAMVSSIAILLGIVLSLMISKAITGPIYKMLSSVSLFSKGDLIANFPTEGRDELGAMGRELQKMSDNLKRIISSVKDASGEILGTSQEFSALAQQTNASVGDFRINVDESGESLTMLASTGEEVNASVEEVSAGAQATAERGTNIARKVDDAMKAGEKGVAQVNRALSGIEGVAGNASSTAKSVQELGERTQQIQSFVTQIGGIAGQTNLLALNAAIEAARAGEAGRGFAVVAEEVRKLAEESNLAAKSIEDLAKTIMGDLNTVVRMSLENAKASEDAKALSEGTAEIIGNIISYLEEIAGATQDLAAVSQQQAASSEEIAEAVQNISSKVHNAAEAGENIRTGVGEVATAAERVATGAEGLSTLADKLNDILSFFKLEAMSFGSDSKDLALRS
ncbi:MAG: methyl-accepting chemotaxis protein [Synergistaceae bacterium]|jgi:methyl-accepting chemotaxis protein|nr:methyl-accepting chemotaxis protein [Synergistaceae bacterium]